MTAVPTTELEAAPSPAPAPGGGHHAAHGPGHGHPPQPAVPSTRLPYLAGLDGLRAIAVLSVLLYHAEYGWATGGFLGVEVFFVISGYLITSLLLAEWRDSSHIALGNFWLRRARRLLPALFVLLGLVTVVAVVFLPDEVASLRGDVLSALAYVTNWNFIFAQKSYFEFIGRPSLVNHLWSLAVEEQFYLVWPLLFVGGMKVFGRRVFPMVVVAGAIGSAILMASLYDPTGDPSRVYYGTDTRAAGLLFGCALAFVWSPLRLRRAVGRGASVLFDVVGALALVVLLRMLMTTDEFWPSLYRGGFLRLDLVTLVVIAVVVHPAAHVGRVLGVQPLRWIGQRSYGIYLFHWPVFQLTRPGLDVSIDGLPLLALRLGLTLGLAELSYRFIEVPIRKGALGRAWARVRAAHVAGDDRPRRRWVLAGVAAVGLLAVLVGVVARAPRPDVPDYLAVGATGPAIPDLEAPPVSVDPATTTTTLDPVATTTPTSALDPWAAPSTTAPPPPTTEPPPTTLAPTTMVTALGDSVMLGAAPALESLGSGVHVDAAVGRQVQVGLEMLTWYRDSGFLADTVVVHLGNNGTFTADQFDQMMEILQGRRVVVLTVKVPRRWEADNNQVIVEGAQRYPGQVSLLDWKSLGEIHPEYFYDDGMHLRPEGGAYYAQLIADVLRRVGGG